MHSFPLQMYSSRESFVFNSLNFEALENDYFSIRIDFHYRLEFKIRTEGTESILTISLVTDITNHYK